jgi:hypothetical protein
MYWRKKESEKDDLFKNLTLLYIINNPQLERQGAYIEQAQELEDLNSSLREKDKMKMTLWRTYPINFYIYLSDCKSLNENNKQRY